MRVTNVLKDVSVRTAVLDGVKAGTITTFASGVPSVSIAISKAPSVGEGVVNALSSIAALGNILVSPTASVPTLYVAGIASHLLLCYGYAVLLSVLFKDGSPRQKFGLSFLAGIFIHVFDLLVVPSVYKMPLIDELLLQTGLLPHFCDHLAFGAAIGWSLMMDTNKRLEAKNE
jgi:hypothetical protein